MAEILVATRNGTSRRLSAAQLDDFDTRFGGEVLLPRDRDYDRARAVWNGMIDRRPALIVRPADSADVVAAVGLARSQDLTLAVRGGGHNVAGSAVNDNGMVIDLRALKSIEVDREQRLVHAGGGVLIGELDAATQAHGLATPMGVVTETGIAGLTLGGGLGWLRRKHGLSCDALVGAELVCADGRVLQVSESEHADLLWALRGGGGNFGIVTRFTFRLYEVGPEIPFAVVFHPWSKARELLRFYDRYCAEAPDEVSSFAILAKVPAIDELPGELHHQPTVLLVAAYAGDVEQGAQALQPLRDAATPLADLTATIPYLEAQQFFDDDYPAGELHYYWKSTYLGGLDDTAIDLLIGHAERMPSPHSTVDIWQLGGAMSRVEAAATAFGDRSAPFLLGVEANWEPDGDNERNIDWTRKTVADLSRHYGRGEYLNFPGLLEDPSAMVQAIYGQNQRRLARIKQAYDPTNLFRGNLNITPSA